MSRKLGAIHFLRSNGVDARLILVNFVGDDEMGGPSTPAEWEAAYQIVHFVMGIPSRNQLARFVHHIYPSVNELNPSEV